MYVNYELIWVSCNIYVAWYQPWTGQHWEIPRSLSWTFRRLVLPSVPCKSLPQWWSSAPCRPLWTLSHSWPHWCCRVCWAPYWALLVLGLPSRHREILQAKQQINIDQRDSRANHKLLLINEIPERITSYYWSKRFQNESQATIDQRDSRTNHTLILIKEIPERITSYYWSKRFQNESQVTIDQRDSRTNHKLIGTNERLVCWILTSLCHSNGHIETMPAREINPFTALTRIRYQFLRTQWSTSNHQRVDTTTPQTAQPSGLADQWA